MSQDRPSINDLLSTVKQFLDDAGPKMEGETKYHAQVSSYLLGICERELRLGAAFDEEEQRRLATFLGKEGSLPDLTTELCVRIRSGAYDDRWEEALELVLRGTIDKVRIVRPGVLAPEHRDAADKQ
ncbi:MAG TPA: DUF6285 domain-containing protein [Alphaproteobacteria bacterium]|nr:DUF6285 domain-containing protein [Alphaproteobacteria bacterium]